MKEWFEVIRFIIFFLVGGLIARWIVNIEKRIHQEQRDDLKASRNEITRINLEWSEKLRAMSTSFANAIQVYSEGNNAVLRDVTANLQEMGRQFKQLASDNRDVLYKVEDKDKSKES